MSFTMVDNFAYLPSSRSIHARRSGNGRFWTCTPWPQGDTGFVTEISDGAPVLRCPPGAGMASIPLALVPAANEPATLFFRFCYPDSEGGSVPSVTLGDELATSAGFAAQRGQWYDAWYLRDAGGWRIYVAETADEPRQVGSGSAPADAGDVVIHAGDAAFLLSHLYVEPGTAACNDPLDTTVPADAPELTLTADKLHVVCSSVDDPLHYTSYEGAPVLAAYLNRAFGVTSIKASGSRIPDRINIHLGDTRKIPGVQEIVAQFRLDDREEFVIFTAGANDVVLAGADGSGSPFNLNPAVGERVDTPSLSAAGRFLERFFGVRWYWPEQATDTGVRVPVVDEVRLPAGLYMRETPTWMIRDLETPVHSQADSNEGDPPTQYEIYGYWYRFNRLGARNGIWQQHRWWWVMPKCHYLTPESNPCAGGTEYPALAPETAHLFALLPVTIGEETVNVRGGAETIVAETDDTGKWVCEIPPYGARRRNAPPPRPTPRYAQFNQLCIGGERNETTGRYKRPLLIDKVLARLQEHLAPSSGSGLPSTCVAPNDGYGHCECVNCLAPDVDDDGNPLHTVPLSGGKRMSIANRMFGFFNDVARRVATRLPDRWVTTHAYDDYQLPHVLLADDPGAAANYLASTLVVFDVHNGYAYVPFDQCTTPAPTDGTAPPAYPIETECNSRAVSRERMRRWARTNGADGTGHLSGYTHLYWMHDEIEPYIKNSPAAAEPRALAEYFALLAWNRYLGSLVDAIPLVDRWLLCRLLADMPPLPAREGEADDPPKEYVDLLEGRIREAMDDYYEGLFGDDAAALVRSLHDNVRASISKAIADATSALSTATTSGSLPELLLDWAPFDVYSRFFAPLFDDEDLAVTITDLQALAKEATRPELDAVLLNWEFSRQTFLYLQAAEQVKITAPREYSAEAVKWCRQFVDAVDARRELVPDPGTVESLAVVPYYVEKEPESWPLMLQQKANSTDHLTLDVPQAVNVCRAVVHAAEAIAGLADAGEPVVRLREPVRTASPWASATDQANGTLWTTQFARVRRSTDGGDQETRSFIIVINDGEETGATLRLDNLDARVTGFSVRVCAQANGLWDESELACETLPPWRWDAAQGPEATSVVSVAAGFTARKGVTVLCVRNGNFAPTHWPAPHGTMGFCDTDKRLVTDSSGAPVTILETTTTKAPQQLVRMFPFDDHLLDGTTASKEDVGFFRLRNASTGTNSDRDAVPGHANNNFYEEWGQSPLDNLDAGTYTIWAFVKDLDGACRQMVREVKDAAGNKKVEPMSLTLVITQG